MTEYRTKTRRVLTEADFAALAVEAEEGYPVEGLIDKPNRRQIREIKEKSDDWTRKLGRTGSERGSLAGWDFPRLGGEGKSPDPRDEQSLWVYLRTGICH
jgi:hypothetical protein